MGDAVSDEIRTKNIIKEFCNYTTAHGFGRLAKAKTRFSQFLWTCFILSAFTMFFYQVHGLFVLYYSRPVSIMTSLKQATVSRSLNWLKMLRDLFDTIIVVSIYKGW